MALKICKKCGYEGKGRARPGRKFGLFKVLGFLLMLPIFSIVKIFAGNRGKYCPHCQTPTMVKLKSDEGWIAQRKFDVRVGLAPSAEEKKNEADTFGAEKPAERIERTVDTDQW